MKTRVPISQYGVLPWEAVVSALSTFPEKLINSTGVQYTTAPVLLLTPLTPRYSVLWAKLCWKLILLLDDLIALMGQIVGCSNLVLLLKSKDTDEQTKLAYISSILGEVTAEYVNDPLHLP